LIALPSGQARSPEPILAVDAGAGRAVTLCTLLLIMHRFSRYAMIIAG
jgi:hypothetical protein